MFNPYRSVKKLDLHVKRLNTGLVQCEFTPYFKSEIVMKDDERFECSLPDGEEPSEFRLVDFQGNYVSESQELEIVPKV